MRSPTQRAQPAGPSQASLPPHLPQRGASGRHSRRMASSVAVSEPWEPMTASGPLLGTYPAPWLAARDRNGRLA